MRRSSGEYLAELLRNQHLSPDVLAQLQARRAAAIARFAADSTAFYRRRFDEHGIDVARLEDPAEWERIPVTERAQVKEHDTDLRPRTANDSLARHSRAAAPACRSAPHTTRASRRSRSPGGCTAGGGCSRGTTWPGSGVGVFGRFETVRNRLQWWPSQQVYLDARLIDADSMRRFHRAIVRTRPALIEGYVGAVLEFADFLDAEGLTIPTPTAVATSAAPLPPSARRRLESVLGAPVYDEYRGSEALWMAGECRMQAGLHIFADARRIEVVDPTVGRCPQARSATSS